MKSIKILFFFSALTLLACKKNDAKNASVTLNFQTTANGSNYSFSELFDNGDGTSIRIELLQFYLSNIRFIDDKGEEIVVEEIALLKTDLTGHSSLELNVPPGDYTSLKFGIGIPNELNEQDPSNFTDEDHPLSSAQNTYWGMNGMYRFVMVDGRYDEDGDGLNDGIFSYHTGYEESYRHYEVNQSFNFDKKEDYTENFNIDVSQLFNVEGSMMDVINESNYHGDRSEIDIAIRLSDNFNNALTVQ